VPLALGFYAAMLGLALGLRALLSGGSLVFADRTAAARGIAWPSDAASGALAGAAVILASRWLTAHTRAGAALARSLARALGSLSPAQCVVLALASGIAEEALFRGALQPSLGWIGASVLFALAHFVPRRELLAWSAFALAGGLLLGGLYAWTGNLLAPVVAHVLVNAVNLRLLTRESEG
jgi:membrane protease YdiL (CAAX protease family)